MERVQWARLLTVCNGLKSLPLRENHRLCEKYVEAISGSNCPAYAMDPKEPELRTGKHPNAPSKAVFHNIRDGCAVFPATAGGAITRLMSAGSYSTKLFTHALFHEGL
jgi:hypothetical protein